MIAKLEEILVYGLLMICLCLADFFEIEEEL